MAKKSANNEKYQFHVVASSRKKARVAKRCLRRLWAFSWEVMQNTLVDNPFHREELDKYDKLRQSGVIAQLKLWPREHLKTTLLTLYGSLRDIAVNPNIRIAIFSATADVAKGWGSALMEHILNNERYNYYYPHVRPEDTKKVKWTPDKFIVKRTRLGMPEGTVQTFGIEKTNVTGLHFDKGIYEDIVNKDNSKTHDRREWVKQCYRMSIPLITRRGEKLVIGTKYDKNDVYRDVEENSFFDVSIRCLTEIDENTKKEYFIFPQMFDERERQQRIEDMKDDYLFNCQYYNRAIGSRKKLFPPGSFKKYTDLPAGGKFFTTVDPAGTTKNYSNKCTVLSAYWAPVPAGITHGRIYVYRYTWLKMTPDLLVSLIATEMIEVRPEILSVEIVKDEGLWALLEREFAEQGIPIDNLQKFHPGTQQSKYERIALIQPRCKAGEILIKEEHMELEEQAEDYTGFLSNEDDDLLDALAQQLFVGMHPEMTTEEEEEDEYEPLFPGTTNY